MSLTSVSININVFYVYKVICVKQSVQNRRTVLITNNEVGKTLAKKKYITRGVRRKLKAHS